MFAVPGWNVSAPLKAQKEDPVEKRGKKRKRKEAAKAAEKEVQPEDVDRFLNGESDEKEQDKDRQDPAKVGGEAEQPASKDGETATKKRKRNRKKNKDATGDVSATPNEQDGGSAPKPAKQTESPAQPALAPTTAIMPKPAPKLTPLQAAMHQKLASARFRHLNETLYTKPSQDSLSLFTQNPDMFNDYHTGFAQQVAVWPENPVDRFVADVLTRGKIGLERYSKKDKKHFGKKDKRTRDAEKTKQMELEAAGLKALPRDFRSGVCTIADLGCGTASFSARLQEHKAAPPKGLGLKVHSFDLHAPSELVTVADIRNLPLKEGEVDIAVFCLALMGTNWVEFIDEAWRILKWKGECWISEIKSRFGRVGPEKKVVGHSVGSLNKKKDKKGKKGKKGQDEDDEVENTSGRPGYVNDEIDDPETHAQRTEQTDITGFIDVMRKHGFALEGEADMSNKMFVKMLFVKAVKPVRGKNVKKDENETKAPKVGKRFLADEEEDVSVEDEGKVLKPCVYKLR